MKHLTMALTVMVQQTAVGLVTTSILHQHYALTFVAALILNGAWWLNAGHRIDFYKAGWTSGVLYTVTAASSVTLGAWLGWR